jgi:hypothetical protein
MSALAKLGRLFPDVAGFFWTWCAEEALLVGGALDARGRRDYGAAEWGRELGEWWLGSQAGHTTGGLAWHEW